MEHPRLRDSNKRKYSEPYPLNVIPKDSIVKLAGYLVYLQYTGRKDITGDEFGDALAYTLGGEHLASPIGIADVILNKMAWSVKTVKNKNPFTAKSIRLISGRCSPDYSYGISDPHEDIQKTGRAVLGIWNERVNIAYDEYNPVRTCVLVRNPELNKFTIFEEENHRFATNNYIWELNNNGNLLGKDKMTGEHCFTWQPHGSQFTIITRIPSTAIKFEVNNPPCITLEAVLENLKFDSSWVNILC